MSLDDGIRRRHEVEINETKIVKGKKDYTQPDYKAAVGKKEKPWATDYNEINYRKQKSSKQTMQPDYKAAVGKKENPWNVGGKQKEKPKKDIIYVKPADAAKDIHWKGDGIEFSYQSAKCPTTHTINFAAAMYYKLCTEDANDIATLPDFTGKTQYDTAFNIYKYVVNHREYNRTRMNSVTAPRLSPNILINTGSGVCRDYAELFAAICMHYNIKVAIVLSIKMNHMWNQIKLDDGTVFHIDATWAGLFSKQNGFQKENLKIDP